MQRPTSNQYNPYFQKYIDLVSDGDFFDVFAQHTANAVHFFEAIPPEKHLYRYAENKWTIKDILMHIIDTERVMSYRALVGARGDSATPLPYMDEDGYAKNVDTTDRSIESLLDEFITIRRSTDFLLKHLNKEQSTWQCNTLGHPTTPAALGYIIVGHVEHHIKVIQERYL